MSGRVTPTPSFFPQLGGSEAPAFGDLNGDGLLVSGVDDKPLPCRRAAGGATGGFGGDCQELVNPWGLWVPCLAHGPGPSSPECRPSFMQDMIVSTPWNTTLHEVLSGTNVESVVRMYFNKGVLGSPDWSDTGASTVLINDTSLHFMPTLVDLDADGGD
jgi:hypothetical protein